jgi:hypothetical protein
MKSVANYICKFQLHYWLLLFLLIVFTIIRLASINIGFCTAWDEAYFLIKLKEAYEDSFITGKSQWNLIAIHWFPYLDLTNPIHSRIAVYLCELFATIAATFTCIRVYGKNRWLKYFTLSYLLFFQVSSSYAGSSLNYVQMQALLMCLALCSFHLYWNSESKYIFFWLVITGISLGQTLFVILPSGILLIVCFGLLLLLKKDGKSILCFGGGLLISLICIHVFVAPLSDILEAMRFTATYFSKSGYRYSPMDFGAALGLLARDVLLCLIICSGIYYLTKRVLKYNKVIAMVLMGILTLFYYYYQKSPQTAVSIIIFCYLLIQIIDNHILSNKCFNKINKLYSLLLVAFPLLASIGTNTYLGDRMICFALAWFLLYLDYHDYVKEDNNIPVVETATLLLLLTLIPRISGLLNKDAHSNFTRGNASFAKISLTTDQVDYFNKCLDVMEEYGYKPDSSVVFTSEYDYSTVFAIDAKLSSNFYQKRNFLYFPKEEMLKPDFVFMCAWDKMEIGKALNDMPWGWPQEFDSVFVGSPEGKGLPWDTDRWLYCRKKEN